MPLLAAGISSFIAWFAAWAGARIGMKAAMAVAIVTVLLASYAAAKVALFAVAAGINAVNMPALIGPIVYVFPSNGLVCLQAIVLSQAILEAYRVWRVTFWGAVQAASDF